MLEKVSAGCEPVRVQVAPDGREVWVTALQSNALLAYSADAPREDRVLALQAVIPVGSEPVGLALIDAGRLALVANSNRGVVPGSAGEGWVYARVPEPSEVQTQGEELEQAREMVRDAISMVLDERRSRGELIPEPGWALVESVEIAA